MASSFRSVSNGFTCGLHRVVFTIPSVGMHSLHVSVNFDKESLSCCRKKQPSHLLLSLHRQNLHHNRALTQLKAALAQPAFILNTALRAVLTWSLPHPAHPAASCTQGSEVSLLRDLHGSKGAFKIILMVKTHYNLV